MNITAPGGQNLESRDKNIDPGQKQKILVSISTRGYTKTLNKKIKIQTNDPDSSTVILTMRAKILEMLSVNPKMINLGKVFQGSSHKREFTVINKGKENISITRITTKPDSLVSVDPKEPFVLKPGDGKKFKLMFNSGMSKGHTGGYVSLETDLEYLPKKIIRVRAQVAEKEPQ